MDVSQAATPAVPTTLRASIQVTKRALELYALHYPDVGGSICHIRFDPDDLADDRFFSRRIYIRQLSRWTLRWNSSLGRTGAPTQGAVLMSLALRMVRGASYPN